MTSFDRNTFIFFPVLQDLYLLTSINFFSFAQYDCIFEGLALVAIEFCEFEAVGVVGVLVSAWSLVPGILILVAHGHSAFSWLSHVLHFIGITILVRIELKSLVYIWDVRHQPKSNN